MSNTALAFPSLLLAGSCLMAQTAAPAPSTAVVYSQPSAADTYIAAHPGAAFFKADSNGLTFQTSNGHYTFFTAPGIVHQENGSGCRPSFKSPRPPMAVAGSCKGPP
jgi:hypothetical protein